jgi:hypothetical protein
VTEVARQAPFPVNESTSLEARLWILHTQIAAELRATATATHVSCDRSVLDNYCYLVNKFGRQHSLEFWLEWWMRSYSLLVGVPPRPEGILPDGFRSENLEFQQRIHDRLCEVLDASPFHRFRDKVVWLEPCERRIWGQRIFAAIAPRLETSDRPIRRTSAGA